MKIFADAVVMGLAAWHFDGMAWTNLPIPENVPHGRSGDAPGLFKVAGSGSTVWVAGGSGLVLHSSIADL